jgi:hypothetical protein
MMTEILLFGFANLVVIIAQMKEGRSPIIFGTGMSITVDRGVAL